MNHSVIMVFLQPLSAQILINIKISASRAQHPSNFDPFSSTEDVLHKRCLNMKAQYIVLEKYLPQHHVLTFVSCEIPDCLKINIDSTLGPYKVFRRRIYTEPGSEQNLGDEAVQSMYRSKILERNKIVRLNTWTEPVLVLVRNKFIV